MVRSIAYFPINQKQVAQVRPVYKPVGISISENHHMVTLPIWWIGVALLIYFIND